MINAKIVRDNLKYLIFVATLLLIGFFELTGRRHYSVSLIVLLSSITAMLFRDDGVFLSFASLLTLYLILFPARRDLKDLQASAKLYFCFFAIISMGFLVGLFNLGDGHSYYDLNNFTELLNVSFFLVVVLVFLNKSKTIFEHGNAASYILIPFVSSVFLQTLSIVALIWLPWMNLPEFLTGSVDLVNEQSGLVARYGGLTGDYELIVDYCFIVIGFCLILLCRGKWPYFAVIGVITAMLLGFLTGTRSFVFGLFSGSAFFGLVILLYLRKKTLVLGYSIATILLLMILIGCYIFFAEQFLIFDRLRQSYEILVSGGGVESAINRRLTATLGQIIDSTPVIGYGSFYNTDLMGNEIVSHNIIFAAYLRYGVLGVIGLTSLLYISARKMYLYTRFSLERKDRFEAAILLSLVFVLAIQELKISALRSSTGILIYTVFFLYLLTRHFRLRVKVD